MIALLATLRPSFVVVLVLAVLAALVLVMGRVPQPPGASAQACNSLTIVKQTNPSPDTTNTLFPFTTSDGAPPASIPSFNLLDGQSMTHTFAPGDDCYNAVTETVPPGWTLTNIACTGATNSFITIVGASGGSPGVFDPGDDTVTVDVAAGENVICTFTNDRIQTGSITTCKQTDPSGGTGFTFGFSSPTIRTIPFTLDDDQCFTWSDLDPADGPYTLSEPQPLPAGWQLAFITCSGGANVLIGSDNDYDPGDTTVTISLGAGEQVACTFYNVQSTRIWGDVDCTGLVDTVDALKVLRIAAGLPVSQNEPCPDLGSMVIIAAP